MIGVYSQATLFLTKTSTLKRILNTTIIMLTKIFLIRSRSNLLFFVMMCLLPSLSLYSQQIGKISGKVIDGKDAKPLSGVTVTIKGSKQATVTNAEGLFQFMGSSSSTLQVTYVGYKSQEVQLKDFNPLTVQLEVSGTSLNEVVVVSYGTQKKRELTGAISSINAEEVKDMPVANIGQKLQGKLPGVQINQNTGQPGAEMAIRIRGQASLRAGNSPLIVVDGFPITSGLNAINPDAIESISVLKDAASDRKSVV